MILIFQQTIDLQNNENNKSCLDNVQKNKSLPLIYDSSDETDDNDNTSNENQNENHDMNNTSESNDKEATQSSNNNINNQNIPHLKIGQTVSFSLDNKNHVVELINRAGKATGKYKNTFNVQYSRPSNNLPNGYVDFDKVKDIHIIETKGRTEEVCIIDENWKLNVYTEVAKSNQPLLNFRWVCSMKNVNDKQVPKARLVAKGFEEQNSDILMNSPTCSKEGLRFVLALIVHNEWKINSIDIKTAFLQGEDIDRELFILPPKEANTCNVWRLKKCPCGLVDASRKWYNKVKSVLLSRNLKMSRGDPSIFYYYKDDKLAGITAIHVDDFLWDGDLLFSNNIISAFCKVFTIGKTSKNTFRYLGLDLNQNR